MSVNVRKTVEKFRADISCLSKQKELTSLDFVQIKFMRFRFCRDPFFFFFFFMAEKKNKNKSGVVGELMMMIYKVR